MPPTGSVLTITFILLGILVTLAAMQLLVAATLPNVVGNARRQMSHHPWWTAAASVIALVVVIVGGFALGAFGNAAQFFRLLWIGGASVFAVCGLAGFSRIVGERMPSAVDRTSPWRPTLRGVIVTELAFTAPFIGWGLFAVAAFMGLGAGVVGAVQAILARRRVAKDRTSRPSVPAPEPVLPEPVVTDEVGAAA